ncbi:MAG: MCE family protein [Chitinophagaceae bacterium]|nr:MCE family protein [Chitinophagaceae bacterium]
MKISNETKVGALTAIAIVVLILGFNFLKGKNLTERDHKLFATFPSVRGLAVSNAVYINGLQVGKVSEMHEKDKNLSGIIITISLTKDINIPKNSVVTITSELLSSTALDIVLGDSRDYTKDGDTLATKENISVMGELTKSINPAINNANKTLIELQMLIQKLSAIVDPRTQTNIQGIVGSLNATAQSLDRLLNEKNGVLSRSLNNVESITGNLAKNNDKINNTLTNLDKASSNFANLKLEQAVESLKNTMAKLDNAVSKIDSKEGTLGLLLNDSKLYDQLLMTNRSLTTLLDDLRVNPKRYVNISVFARKDKKGPLPGPLYDSTSIQGRK